ncbi:MAG: Tn3 family transposase [Granulicella sp.]
MWASSRCYLHEIGPRREINEGLNVIESWNSAREFIFFKKRRRDGL